MKKGAPKESFVYRKIKQGRRFLDMLAAMGVLISKERRYSTKLSFRKKLHYWRKGFLSDSSVQYFEGKSEIDYKEYLSDYQRWVKIPVINAKYGIVLADKLMFTDYYDRFKEHLAPVYFLVKNKHLYSEKFEPRSVEDFIEKIKAIGDVIIKPKSGYGGLGIFLFEFREGQFWCNKAPFEQEKIEEWLLSLHDYIVMDRIKQTGYANEIYPETVNTVRLVTMIDPVDGSVHIANAAQRFGTKNTIPADNWTSGGMSASIDLDTGKLGKCALNPQGGSLIWLDKHPDSGKLIDGVEIKNWKSVCKKIKEIARFNHYCPYIGWDLVINESGFLILEANDSPDVHILQIHGPMINTEKNKNFFSYYNVI